MQDIIKTGFLWWFIIATVQMTAQSAALTGVVTSAETGTPLPRVQVFLTETEQTRESDNDGRYTFADLSAGEYTCIIFAQNYKTVTETLSLAADEKRTLNFSLENLDYDLETVQIEARKRAYYGLRPLRNVEGFAIYAGRKSEVINTDSLVANTAVNNARQVFKGIAGLNIWENDGAGLQLSIGARGLNPNRTSNFNTRQNGYDISADALGYPESYYTPPTQALQRIEVVRGAAALQYGPQFGGLLNFVFKEGNRAKAFEFITENTMGSFGLLTTFNSIGGEKKGLNYYAFYQGKRGDGWRPNSRFEQHTAYAKVSKRLGERWKVGAEYTYMDYLAQQPGGLADFEFRQDPRQSKRERNWFAVNWNLAALHADYRLSDRTKINSRSFFLSARRQALGVLSQINRPDPLRERDLIRGIYQNIGNETRLLHRYGTGKRLFTLLTGVRFYRGDSASEQGLADATAAPNFSFLNPHNLETAAYTFPSRNFASFAEHLFTFNGRWTITPGIRFERIRTAAAGFFKERVLSGGEVIFEQTFDVNRTNARNFVLLGLGTSYKFTPEREIYANFSQNFRSVNFTDLAVVNPNLVVDSLLTDERGYNLDLGFRGTFREVLSFDASVFYLSYRDRIGTGELLLPDVIFGEVAVPFRTNIGDARIIGLEAYAELNILRLVSAKNKNFALSAFTNFSLLQGKYLSGGTAFRGNDVELIPPYSLKTGVNLRWKKLRFAYQIARTAEHFSDATNATFTNDATRGLIPAYTVQDLSASWTQGKFSLQAGINNLGNARYFTRRAATYPGPGIIPADGRSFYVTAGFAFGK